MPEFLAETYTAPEALSSAALRVGELAQAVGPAAPARFLGAIAVPAEETCFYLYQAPTAAAVRAAMAAAGLRPERITPAVTIRPPSPARPSGGARAVGPPPPARPR